MLRMHWHTHASAPPRAADTMTTLLAGAALPSLPLAGQATPARPPILDGVTGAAPAGSPAAGSPASRARQTGAANTAAVPTKAHACGMATAASSGGSRSLQGGQQRW
jgi:hypothetical protein